MKNYRQFQKNRDLEVSGLEKEGRVTGQSQRSQPSQYGRYKAYNQKYYVDTHEQEKKRQNQNYSNLMGQSLGDPSRRGDSPDPAEHGKNTLEMTLSEREHVQEDGPAQRLLPSIHYSEFKNSQQYQEAPAPKSNLEMMEERTQRMREALQKAPEYAPSNATISEDVQSEQGRNFYRNAMGHGTNPINYTENQEIYGQGLNEHEGDVVIRFYKVQGYKYTLMRQTDKEIQAEFLRNGYHVMNLQIVRDPISGDANGKVTFKARLPASQERLFEHFMKTSMNYVVMAKK